jgi:formate hydrogenlyase transcriptional activator
MDRYGRPIFAISLKFLIANPDFSAAFPAALTRSQSSSCPVTRRNGCENKRSRLARSGSLTTVSVSFRLVAATNRDLFGAVETGQFRRDLYYRLNVFPIELPPLRERPEDIPLLVSHFATACAQRMNKSIDIVRRKDMETLVRYSWPGNVRELQNLIERSAILSTDRVLYLPALRDIKHVAKDDSVKIRSLADAEREHILQTLRQTDWVVGGRHGAAARLEVRRTTLLYKMRRLGISRPQN